MAKQTVNIKATNEKELTAELINLSNQNPGKAVTAYVTFGICRAYIYPSVARISVDQPDSRQMLSTYQAIAFVNGKLAQPSKGWMSKQVLADKRTHE
jgi:hypothetical protein